MGLLAHLVPLGSLENMDHQVCLALLGTWEYQGSREPRVTVVPLEASDPRERRERGRRERGERKGWSQWPTWLPREVWTNRTKGSTWKTRN